MDDRPAAMIVFGSAVSDRAVYERYALPGIRRAAEPDSVVVAHEGFDSIQRPYNMLMEQAAAHDDLEALVLLHQDLELLDDSLPARVRRVLADPRVGVVGSLGARNIPLHRWTETDMSDLYGTAVLETIERRFSSGSHEVEATDGQLLVIAPWAVRALRFGEDLARNFHGYDVDFCMRVRSVGGTVICDDIPYCHYASRWDDHEAIRLAGIDLALMWDAAIRPREWDPAFQS